jgi:uncharacterized protein (TIGR03083 family)
MKDPVPVIATGLFPQERQRLLALLDTLSPVQFDHETSCPGWSVKDILAHLVGDDLGALSGGRDHYSGAWYDPTDWHDLVAFINHRNQAWVEAMRRLSPGAIRDLLADSGPRVQALYASYDPYAPGPNVAWAGDGAMPMWLHLAREYTERWLHQTQVREAVGAEPLYERDVFHPVLATFVYALPVAYRGTLAPVGTHVRVVIEGDAGGLWSLVRGNGVWELKDDVDAPTAATVRIDQDLAWRLWTKGAQLEVERRRIRVNGDAGLAEPALHAVAIIA